jgi:ATP synthase protein I
MGRDDGSPDFDDFDDRVRKLRVDAGLPTSEPESKPAPRASYGGAGVQVGVELVAGVVAGGLIGYGLDRWLDTWPALFLVFFFLGAGAGMLNAYRHIQRAMAPPAATKGSRGGAVERRDDG